MTLALRGLETKTTDPYLAGWRKRVVPTLGNLPMTMICNGAVDRAVHGWIADDCSSVNREETAWLCLYASWNRRFETASSTAIRPG